MHKDDYCVKRKNSTYYNMGIFLSLSLRELGLFVSIPEVSLSVVWLSLGLLFESYNLRLGEGAIHQHQL